MILLFSGKVDSCQAFYGQLAQLVRASGLHPECREFDPLTAHIFFHKNVKISIDFFKFFMIYSRSPSHDGDTQKFFDSSGKETIDEITVEEL